MDKKRLIVTTTFVWPLVLILEHGSAQTPAAIPPPSSAKVPSPSVKMAAAPPAAPVAPATPKPAYQTYTYYGDRYRDPFIPLTGDFHKEQLTDRPPQISTLLLKGIMQDQKGRMALLTSGSSSYILRGGRLYDGRNHLMKGISGVIKQSSVVLMGSDRTVREIRVVTNL